MATERRLTALWTEIPGTENREAGCSEAGCLQAGCLQAKGMRIRIFGIGILGLWILGSGSFVLSGTSAATSQDGGERATPPLQLLSQGIHALTQGDHPTARQHFRALVKAAPEHGPGNYYLAVTELYLGNPEAAFTALETAVGSGFVSDSSALRSDPYLRERMESEALKARWEQFLTRLDARAHGLVAGLAFTFRLQDAEGKVYSPASFAGRNLAVAFLEVDSSNSLGAAYLLEKLQKERPDLAAVGVVAVPGKDVLQQVEALTRYRETTRIAIPLLLSEPEVALQLRPYRGAPTVLFLDAEGRAQRVVEAAGPEFESRMRSALAALPLPAPARPDDKPRSPAPPDTRPAP